MSSPSAWTNEQVLQLEAIWLLCLGRRDAHRCAAVFYGRWHKIFTFPNVLIGSVLSTLTFNPDNAPPALATTLSVCMTLFATTTSFFNLAQKAEGHRTCSRGFTILLREMEMCILRGRTSPKREFVDFLEYINDRFTELIDDSPDLHGAAQKILDEVRKTRPTPFDAVRENVDLGSSTEVMDEITINNDISIPVSVPE